MEQLEVDSLTALREAARLAKLPPTGPPRARRRRDTMFPWLLSLAVTVPVSIIASGTERAVAIGASVALLGAAAMCTWLMREERRDAEKHLRATEEHLRTEADDRADMLVRQFGWSIDEIIVLRRRLKIAELREGQVLERNASLEAVAGEAQSEARRAKQAVFELAAVDVRELRDARDSAVLAREAADRRAKYAEEALVIAQQQLSAAHQRVGDLTQLLASLSTARELVLAAGGDAAPAAPAGAASPETTWGLGEVGGALAVMLRTTLPVRAVRLRDPAGATLLVKRQERRGRGRKALLVVPISDPDIAASLETEPRQFRVDVLVGDKWDAATFDGQPSRTHTDKRDRVWRRGTPIIRIAG